MLIAIITPDQAGLPIAPAPQHLHACGFNPTPGNNLMCAGGALDLAELCIVAGKTCWVIFVDGLVLNADGSVIDALSIATKVCISSPNKRQ